MIVSISTTPIGEDVSVSKYVKRAIEVFKKRGLKMVHSPMSTCIEGEMDEIFDAVKEVHQTLADMGCQRISTLIKIDDRRDKKATLEDKLNAIS